MAVLVRADIALNHAQHAGPLIVDNGRRAGIDHHMISAGDLNGKGGNETVPHHGRRSLAVQELIPGAPVRMGVGHNPVAEIGGKALVEPQIFPVGRRYQIAEPLVGDLMGDDLTDPLNPFRRGGLWEMEQQVFPECDGAPVFHGAESKIGNGNQVHLGQRIVDAVIIFAILQRFAAKGEP